MDLFTQQRRAAFDRVQPLPVRMRPKTLDEFVGQEHFVGPGKLLRRLLAAEGVLLDVRLRHDDAAVGARRDEAMERALAKAGLARREEVEDLALRVAQLEHRLRLLERDRVA